jgi:BON domain
MRRLLALLLAVTAAAAVLVRRKRAQAAMPPAPAPMPAPTAPPRAAAPVAPVATPGPEPAREPAAEPASEPTPGPIDEGEPGAITTAPVPDATAVHEAATVETPDDDTLVREVESELAKDPAVPDDAVKVDVEEGVAELTGTVPDAGTAQRVGDDAAHVDGVIGLDNKLEPGESAARRDEDD